MPRTAKPANIDAELAALEADQRRLDERKKAVKAKQQAVRNARLIAVGSLADAAGIADLPNDVLAAGFAALAAQHSAFGTATATAATSQPGSTA